MRPDTTSRFVFEEVDCRGELVHLDRSYREALDIHQYPPAVARSLGEFMAAAVLLSTTIKFEGRLILQAQAGAQVALLMAECTNRLAVRAIARGAAEATGRAFADLFHGGRLAITIEPKRGRRYQGIVEMAGDNLAACIEAYFDNSEQLPTRLWLAADGQSAAGLLLQQMPDRIGADVGERKATWDKLTGLAARVDAAKLLGGEREGLLSRLFSRDPVRVFPESAVQFACSCSRERCLDVLRSINPAELEGLLQEQGAITMDCEFCTQQYRFEAADLVARDQPDAGHSIH